RLRSVSGPVFKTLEMARKAVGGDTGTSHMGAYGERMGRRFEQLIRWALTRKYSADQVIAEHEYALGQNAKSPDAIVFEGKTALLFQAKLKRMSPGAFFGHSLEDFRRDAEGAYAEMIWRSLVYLRNLESYRARGRLNPAHLEVSQRVLSAERIYLLGIAPFLSA